MKNWFKILICVFTISCGCQSKILTEIQFSEIYRDSLIKQFPNAKFSIKDDLEIVSDFDGKTFTHYMDNPYKEYKLSPKRINEIISRYIASSAELYKETEPIQLERIIPMIKPMGYLDELKKISNGKEPWIVYEKYNDQLIIVYGENTEKSIKYPTNEEFNKLNINKDTLLELSIKNLRKVLPDLQIIGDKGNYGIAAGGDFETSLILFPNLWTKENFKVDGDFVIGIPNKDLLMITGSNDKKGIEKLKGVVSNSNANGNHPVSPYLFKWNGKRFEKYD